MREIRPNVRLERIDGCFIIDEANVAAVLGRLRHYVTDQPETTLTLELKNRRQYEVDDVSKLGQLPFDDREGFGHFEIAVRSGDWNKHEIASVSYQFSRFGDTAEIHVAGVEDVEGAVASIAALLRSTRCWYTNLNTWWPNIAAVLDGLIVAIFLYAAWIVLPSHLRPASFVIAAPLAFLLMKPLELAKRALFSNSQVMYGLSAGKELARQKVRRWFAAPLGAGSFVALIAAGITRLGH